MSLIEKNEDYSNMLEMRRKHEAILAEQGLSVFCEVTNVRNSILGSSPRLRHWLYAGLDANTIIFGIHDESTATLSRLLRFRDSLVIWKSVQSSIDTLKTEWSSRHHRLVER